MPPNHSVNPITDASSAESTECGAVSGARGEPRSAALTAAASGASPAAPLELGRWATASSGNSSFSSIGMDATPVGTTSCCLPESNTHPQRRAELPIRLRGEDGITRTSGTSKVSTAPLSPKHDRRSVPTCVHVARPPPTLLTGGPPSCWMECSKDTSFTTVMLAQVSWKICIVGEQQAPALCTAAEQQVSSPAACDADCGTGGL